MIVFNSKPNNYTIPLKKLGDLIYHEGPILSLFIDDHSNMFLNKWVDCDDNTNHWMLSSISSFELSQFYHKTISLRQYYKACNQWAIIEIDNYLKIRKLYPLEHIPNAYLPKEDSFYSDILYTEFSNSLRAIYINNLAVISKHKSNVYDILELKIASITNSILDYANKSSKDIPLKETTLQEAAKNLSGPKTKNNSKDILPKSSDVLEIVQLFRALNHNIRKRILEFIGSNPGVNLTDIYTSLKIDKSVTAQHVAILRRSNLLTSHRKGNIVLYATNQKKLEEVQAAIDTLIEERKIIYQ